jgi:hypothetical protein
MKLVGANSDAAVAGVDRQPGVVSYLIGNDPKKWHSGIPTYGKVNYVQIYPGVDLVFYGNQRQLEYDFIVAPGADPSRIAWQIDGASATLDAEGNLVLSAANGPASFKKPVLYQMDGDKKIGVEGSFEVAGDQIRFRLGSYDHSRALIIDPVLSYASYLSGSGNDYIGNTTGPGIATPGSSQGLAVDSEGSAYVTGHTYSVDFPTQNPYQGAPPAKVSGVPPGDWPSAFVTKFSPDGSSLVYSTYLGGNGFDIAYAIAVDSKGDAYVTGMTDSPDFPTTAGAYQTICDPAPYNPGQSESSACGGSNASAFVTELNPTGTGLVYSTFLGGYAYAYATAIAVDSAGRAYIAGDEEEYCSTYYTFQSCFPTTSGAVIPGSATGGGSPQYAFVAAFDPTGAQLLYSTIFGDLNGFKCASGCGGTYGTGVTVGANGYFYLVGETMAGDLPTTAGVIQPTSGPLGSGGTYVEAWRGFIAKFSPVTSKGGVSLDYATYLGGHTEALGDFISGITIDGESNAYIVGYTNSPDFPVTAGAYSTVCGLEGNCSAAHVTKLNPSASAILWSTFVGGAKSDGSDSVFWTGPVQLDGDGNVYIIGQCNQGFPMINPVEPTPTGGALPVLVAELDPAGANLLFSTTIGSDGLDYEDPAGLAVDSAGDIYLAGNTIGPDLITTPGAFQTTNTKGGCCYAGFVAKIAPSTAGVSPRTLTFAALQVNSTSSAQAVTLTNTGNVALAVASITTSGDFAQTDNCGSSVAAGGSCTINVTFRPLAGGRLTGVLTITDNANGVAGSTQTVSLSGAGTVVSLSATSLNFGAQPVGSRSLMTVTLTNLGSTPLSISGLSVVSIAPLTPLGTKAGDFTIQSGSCVAGGSVAGLGSCTINLAFRPTAAGVHSATLVIADSDPSSPQTVNLRGTGR